MVEPQIVDLVVAGSSPVFHPFFILELFSSAPVAQLDRASDFESAGYRFEPCQVQRSCLAQWARSFAVGGCETLSIRSKAGL